MAESRVFLRFDGRLWENLEFQRRAGWETERLATDRREGTPGYALDLLDEAGESLVSTTPEVDFTRESTSPMESMRSTRIVAYVPLHPDGRQLVFRHGDRVIHREEVAADPPRVELTQVRPIKDGRLELRWRAEHSHDRPLTFNVIFLLEGGRAFQLARDLTEPHFVADPSQLPGGRGARLAVLATDGTRSGFAVSDPVEVAQPPPQVWIQSPGDGAQLPPDQPVSLIGQATDVAGASLDDANLAWRVDGKLVARGERLALAAPLEPGKHELTLDYLDGDTVAATGTVTVQVAVRSKAQQRLRDMLLAHQPAAEHDDGDDDGVDDLHT